MSLILLGMEFQIFAPEYLIDCSVLFVLYEGISKLEDAVVRVCRLCENLAYVKQLLKFGDLR